jgi:hypothetical protein
MKSKLDKKIAKANKGLLLEEIATYLEKLADAGIKNERSNMVGLSQLMREKLKHLEIILVHEAGKGDKT